MQIYYSRVKGTEESINGSALQEIINTLGIAHNVNLVKYQQEGVYSFDKLDNSDVLILGYNEDRHDKINNEFIIGKGVYNELQRADAKGIPMFFLNLSGNHGVYYLEAIYTSDVTTIDESNYQEYAKIDLYYSYQHAEAGKVQASIKHADELERFFIYHEIDLNKITTVTSKTPEGKYLKVEEYQENVISNNILLLRRKK
jgi:hypothetical protein